MAIASRDALIECDGFCVEAADRPIGWVEEAWLGADEEPAALALHLVDGRRGLLPVEDVERVDAERERIVMRDGARVLELGAPHIVGNGAAAWETTGALVEPPAAGTMLPQSVLELRLWRMRGRRASEWRVFPLVIAGIFVLIGVEIGLVFLVAYLVTGHAT